MNNLFCDIPVFSLFDLPDPMELYEGQILRPLENLVIEEPKFDMNNLNDPRREKKLEKIRARLRKIQR